MGGGVRERKKPIFRDIRRYDCEYCGTCRSKKALLTSHLLSCHQDEMEKQRAVEDAIHLSNMTKSLA
ncbi:hypothetical protein F0562_019964 [Nyssa sinensis]|uniref:C2H2-type domain-containing protein n=1 Tax=Nyssa sinensis TaxID=561372 RepID=A0A5J5BTP3_9ASTE|nr:hypothetical protein F0562_019964 [Nyssa sinensis]